LGMAMITGTRIHKAICLLTLSISASGVNSVSVTEVLSLDVESPAVTTFVNAGILDPSNPVVLATTFSPTAKHDNVFMLQDIVISSNNSAANIITVDDDATWPNQADPIDNGIIVSENSGGIIGAGGFFVNVPFGPSKSTGSVDLYFKQNDSSTAFSKIQASTDKDNYFYHKAGLIDANGDGLSDLMGARCYVPSYGIRSPLAELVVMTQPSEKDDPWETTVVFNNGPDVSFVLVDLDNDGKTQVISTEYFVNQRLALYSCNHDHWIDCVDGSNVTEITIDSSEGAMFNVYQIDLNGDGIQDLLATSQGDSGSGYVLAYEQPKGAWNDDGATWDKHMLADGYAPLKSLIPGQGSPGTAVPFPSPLTNGVKPWIVVSADDGGWVDLLVPYQDDNVDDWSYNKTRIVQSDGTVGTPTVGDLDNDGVPEIIVPLYNENRIAVYTLNF